MSRILAIAVKDLRLLLRDYGGMFFVLVFPLLMALLFGSIFSSGGGGARGMRIAVPVEVNEKEQAFYDQLGKADVLRIVPMPTDSGKGLVSEGKLVAFVEYKDTASADFAMFAGSRPEIDVLIDPSRRAEAGYLTGLINQAYFTVLQQSMMDLPKMQTMLDD
ncbi:ABC transporter permease, partial [candidate division GN15 bacterium]|nr:ABC transporter permease [candidate division GN15 bacterium]